MSPKWAGELNKEESMYIGLGTILVILLIIVLIVWIL